MRTIGQRCAGAFLLGALLLNGSGALAGQPEESSATDVKLDGFDADAYVYRSDNASSVPTDFSSALYGTGSWTTIATFSAAADNQLPRVGTTALGLDFSLTFDQIDSRHGTWTVHNKDKAHHISLDLGFGLSGTDGNGAWLFDNQVVRAGQSLSGDWDIKFYDYNHMATYSGLNLFAREVNNLPLAISPVPEPGTYAMLLAGLGVVFMARRRKQENARFF